MEIKLEPSGAKHEGIHGQEGMLCGHNLSKGGTSTILHLHMLRCGKRHPSLLLGAGGSQPHLHHHLLSPHRSTTQRGYVPLPVPDPARVPISKGKETALVANFLLRIFKWLQADLSLHWLLKQGIPETALERRMFTNLSKPTHLILLTMVQMSSTLRMVHLTLKKTCSAIANHSLEAWRNWIFPPTPICYHTRMAQRNHGSAQHWDMPRKQLHYLGRCGEPACSAHNLVVQPWFTIPHGALAAPQRAGSEGLFTHEITLARVCGEIDLVV